jgi:transcriptional regulator with XRE-family HTH domain
LNKSPLNTFLFRAFFRMQNESLIRAWRLSQVMARGRVKNSGLTATKKTCTITTIMVYTTTPKKERAAIVPAQIRAARGLVGWTQEQLATAAEVGLSTVRDIEGQRRGDEIGAISAIVRALENEGVTFVAGDKNDGPGVRISTGQPNIILRPSRMVSDVLPFTVEWRGQRVIVCVAREPLEDFETNNFHHKDAEFVAAFEKNKRAVLDAAAKAIDAGKVTRDGRVYLDGDDFPQLK